MAHQTYLAEVILEKSSELFRKQGYVATTIKQIASAAGCTTAALYYYFEGGKTEILSEVIRSSQNTEAMLEGIGDCSSLSEFIDKLTHTLAPVLPKRSEQMNWLMSQFGNLPEDQKLVVQSQILDTQQMLKGQIECFVDSEIEAERLAWLIFNAFIGYEQTFFRTEIGKRVDFSIHEYGQFIATMIEKSHV